MNKKMFKIIVLVALVTIVMSCSSSLAREIAISRGGTIDDNLQVTESMPGGGTSERKSRVN